MALRGPFGLLFLEQSKSGTTQSGPGFLAAMTPLLDKSRIWSGDKPSLSAISPVEYIGATRQVLSLILGVIVTYFCCFRGVNRLE
jgi:hypothetical protein